MKNILLSLIFIAIGITMIILGFVFFQKGSASINWPTVQGKVFSSYVKEIQTVSGSDSKNLTKKQYLPVIKYTYKIGGIVYMSNRIGYGSQYYTSKQAAYEMVGKYSRGAVVTVYYNPKAHGMSVLETGVSLAAYILLVMGIVFIGIGGLFLKTDKKKDKL